MTAEFDSLLHWMSERRSGSTEILKSSVEWAVSGVKFSSVCRGLAALGFLEVDWSARRWCVPPASLVLLPEAGLTAVIVGARDGRVRRRIEALEENDGVDVVVERRPTKSGPESIFVVAGDWDALTQAADAIGVPFHGRFSVDLSRRIPPIGDPGGASLPLPPTGVDVYDVERLRFVAGAEVPRAGLVVRDHFGQRDAYWSNGSGWRRVDLDHGRYLELRRVGRAVIQFFPGLRTGTLMVPSGAPLPPLQLRAAALCSGSIPSWASDGERYVNVPEVVARAVSESLWQRLVIQGRKTVR